MFNQHLQKVKTRQDLFYSKKSILVENLRQDIQILETSFEAALKIILDKNDQDSLDETIYFLSIMTSLNTFKEEKVVPELPKEEASKSSKKIV